MVMKSMHSNYPLHQNNDQDDTSCSAVSLIKSWVKEEEEEEHMTSSTLNTSCNSSLSSLLEASMAAPDPPVLLKSCIRYAHEKSKIQRAKNRKQVSFVAETTLFMDRTISNNAVSELWYTPGEIASFRANHELQAARLKWEKCKAKAGSYCSVLKAVHNSCLRGTENVSSWDMAGLREIFRNQPDTVGMETCVQDVTHARFIRRKRILTAVVQKKGETTPWSRVVSRTMGRMLQTIRTEQLRSKCQDLSQASRDFALYVATAQVLSVQHD